ncbi:hypothetical protein JOL79_12845 [Microbispora sp. RL4-1S]|uniref:Lipoprotein n=1 Tax=Microbispora oryzae TaxID=2806554 RepID=A0A940WIS4_9ACTN|nr:hypothetical protein [Microbispora oryzae]MBP2704702.1 hypothetical protein [Microbispora oryzae]
MLRRITAAALGLALLSGCGGENASATPAASGDGRPAPSATAAATVTQADVDAAFDGLKTLENAWKQRDCAAIAMLTTWVEGTLGDRICAAARDGRPAPGFTRYTDPELVPPAAELDDSGDGRWFAVLARHPSPAYFVFVRAGGRWRLGAGPIPVVGDAPAPDDVEAGAGSGGDAAADSGAALRARLVPTRHVAFLTDPANVGGVKIAAHDPVRALMSELVRAPARARPDRLSVDVQLEGEPRAIALPDGAALVFHALRVVTSQRPGQGHSTLTHPRYGAADVRAFTGGSAAAGMTGSELVLLATKVTAGNVMSTVAIRRSLADITPGTSG